MIAYSIPVSSDLSAIGSKGYEIQTVLCIMDLLFYLMLELSERGKSAHNTLIFFSDIFFHFFRFIVFIHCIV